MTPTPPGRNKRVRLQDDPLAISNRHVLEHQDGVDEVEFRSQLREVSRLENVDALNPGGKAVATRLLPHRWCDIDAYDPPRASGKRDENASHPTSIVKNALGGVVGAKRSRA